MGEKIWEYVDYQITPQIKEKTKQILEWLKDTYWKKQANPDPKTKKLLEKGIKVKGLRRMVFGFWETIKQLKLENAFFIVISKNVIKVDETDSQILEIQNLAR